MADPQDRFSSHRTRRQLLALMGAGTTIGLAGCSGGGDGDDSTPADDEPSGDDSTPGSGNGDTDTPTPDEMPMDGEFVGTLGANPSTMDPINADATSSTCTSLMYETLVELDFENRPQPALAADWEQVDETTYRFELREGVQFHSGGEMTAEDVQASTERMIGTVQDAAVSTWYEDSEVVDDYTIEYSLSQPHAPFLVDLSGVPITPAGLDKPGETDALESESRGTGPFVFENFEPEDRVELVRNEDYWWEETEDMPGMAPWESVTLRVVPEITNQQEALRAGDVEIIDNASPVDLDTLDGEDGLSVVSTTGIGFDLISFPVNEPPYTNPKFRRGITRLIPSDDIVDAVFSGRAEVQASPISPALTDFYDREFEEQLLDEYVGEDREAAMQLLDEAFEEEDIERPFEINLITNVNETRERWMEVIQQTLDETEYFDANLDIQAFDQLVPFLTSGDAAESTDIVGIGWTTGPDPNGHVESLVHSDFHVPDGFNWNLYENDEADQLIEDARQETDLEARKDLYEELSTLLAEEVPSAYMWTSESYEVVSTDDIQNWRSYSNSSLRYAPMYRPYLDQVAWEPEA